MNKIYENAMPDCFTSLSHYCYVIGFYVYSSIGKPRGKLFTIHALVKSFSMHVMYGVQYYRQTKLVL